MQVINPATGGTLTHVHNAKAVETCAAIASASAAFGPWSKRTGKDRMGFLRRWQEELIKAKDDIVTLMTLECGKPKAESSNEFSSGLESVSWFAEEARRVHGDVLPTTDRNKRYLVLKQPVGVVAAITPWNFPMSMICRKVSAALAAGCPVVLKPSELTPLTALAIAKAAQRAGFPNGVFNVVCGDNSKAIGDELLKSKDVRKIGFTGSTRVGKMLYAGSANTVKRLSLELGGNAPFIVFEDADIEKAARDVAMSSYRNAGQTCICTNRAFVHEAVYDKFNEALVNKVSKMRLGSGIDPATNLGPLITADARDRVEDKVNDAVSRGATVAIGGKRPAFEESHPLRNGFFYEPTVLTNATIDMKVYSQEIFGPVTPVFKFSSEEEAIQLANNTEYGLAAYFYSKDLSRAFRVAEGLEYGMIGVNEVAITSEIAPFGGVKESGIGREQSIYGLDEFLELKTVCLSVA